MKHLEARAEDSENRNRGNNLRIIRLPEGAKGWDPVAFAERLFPLYYLEPTFQLEGPTTCWQLEALSGGQPFTFIF